MIAGGLTVLGLVLGGFCLWLKDKAQKGTYGIGVLAMVLILGAGLSLPQIPWMGPVTASVLEAIKSNGGLVSILVTVAAIALSGLWIAAALPDKAIKHDLKDWLAYCGLLIPTLVSSLPGPLGRGIADLMTALGGVGVDIGTALFAG